MRRTTSTPQRSIGLRAICRGRMPVSPLPSAKPPERSFVIKRPQNDCTIGLIDVTKKIEALTEELKKERQINEEVLSGLQSFFDELRQRSNVNSRNSNQPPSNSHGATRACRTPEYESYCPWPDDLSASHFLAKAQPFPISNLHRMDQTEPRIAA